MGPGGGAMHMDNLWFDLAVRGEPDLQEDALARLGLSDEAEPDRDESEYGGEGSPEI
jgi:hypothetical protein